MADDDYVSIYNAAFFKAWKTFNDEIGRVFNCEVAEQEARPVATKQTRYVLANLAIADLFYDIGQRETAAHFHKLAEALQNVVEGINHPLFKVEKADRDAAGKRGRQHDTSETWRIRASLCIGIEFLIASDTDKDNARENAISFVDRKHRKQLVKLLRPGTNLKSSLRTWLKTFATDATTNRAALDAYKTGIEGLSAAQTTYTAAQIRSAGERLVSVAAERAADVVKI
jgi:hypothetical protein